MFELGELLMKDLGKCVFLSLMIAAWARPALAENWPTWRGPRLGGTSREKNIPVGGSTESNIVWKTALPGFGHASSIVCDNQVFTVLALPETQERSLVCLDRKTGKILWLRAVIKSRWEAKHSLNNRASSTPATDGELVYVSFLDENEMVVAAFDVQGKQKMAGSSRPFLEQARLQQFAHSLQG